MGDFVVVVVAAADKVGPTMAVLRQDIHQNIQVETEH